MSFKKVQGVGALGLAVLLATSLSACGSKKDEPAKSTQVVAQVNKEEITVSQLNFILSRVPGVRPEVLPQVKKELLDRLIEQEVMVQAAVEQKLDRDPAIQQQIEAARREILARSLAEKVANSVAKPDEREIAEFFEKNPDFFSKRRVYKFDEISIPISVARRPEVNKMLEAAKTLGDVSEGLRNGKMDAPVSMNITRPAEDMPIALVPKLSQFKDGDVFRYDRGQAHIVAKLVSSREAPVEQDKAKGLISLNLHNRKKAEVVPVEIKRLKDAAKITYLGEFSPEAIKAAEAAKAAAPPVAPPAAPAKPSAAETEKSAIDKGLKGLK